MTGGILLTRCYRDLRSLPRLSAGEWDLLIRQGRRAGLLGRLHGLCDAAGLLQELPPRPRTHLTAARVEADRVAGAACWEMGQIAEALAPLAVPLIALKGSAYALRGLTASLGRAFSDLDILVPRPALEAVEKRLRGRGWITTHLDTYDQRYYRQWMHELPPMQHMTRKTNLDVHHGLLPDTVRRRPDPRLLLADAVPVPALDGVYTLSPVDTWLHSATHLFQEGEFRNALRDLTDLDLLAREFDQHPGFWEQLPTRARQLQLERQLYYGLRYCDRLLGTPIPQGLLEESRQHAPRPPLAGVMDLLFGQVFRPQHRSCRTPLTGVADTALYLRSHAIRMPARLLLPHLAHKSLVTPFRNWQEARRHVRPPAAGRGERA
ncbi:MAG TPA: hypothetical protein ENK50_03695 [Sedimenticola sp.]|nr:hypothetical protein [Sedimenticola sp.]